MTSLLLVPWSAGTVVCRYCSPSPGRAAQEPGATVDHLETVGSSAYGKPPRSGMFQRWVRRRVVRGGQTQRWDDADSTVLSGTPNRLG